MPDADTDRDHEAAVTVPLESEIPSPATVTDSPGADGYVVWHRKHLRVQDHRALADAVTEGDVVCPLFVFDPAFYAAGGLACDARLRFLHEAITSLDGLYAAVPAGSATTAAPRSRSRLADQTDIELPDSGRSRASRTEPETLEPAANAGLTVGYGDPAALLSRFVERGWSVLTMATPTSRYGLRRDRRVEKACDGAIEFCSGDGLVRDREWTRRGWQDDAEAWLTAAQHDPDWDDTTRLAVETGLTPAGIDDAFGVTPTKTKVPTGTHRAATTRLGAFVDRLDSYPGNISAPGDAREGTSGLSPYINFGLLSVRQSYQHVVEAAPESRGRSMFVSRLFWNLHYNQKLADWPGWTTTAVNPVLAGQNEDSHDPALVEAWKQGQTGYPMVDASMRCLRETGWLNFRMRAMCASFFTHILHQPWWIGADWYHHHLVDSDVGINYTQWQSQAGLIGKPSQRVYNPRKQVRDHDPRGEWITEWVPELDGLPDEFLPRPERTPLDVQSECGVSVGEDYPRPVVEFEARREAYWDRFERLRPAAAEALGRPEIAKRASLSGGFGAARAIAEEYGGQRPPKRQAALDELEARTGRPDSGEADPSRADDEHTDPGASPPGAGSGDREQSPEGGPATEAESDGDDGGDGQTTLGRFGDSRERT